MDTRYTELFSKERKDIEAMTQEQKIEHMEQLKNVEQWMSSDKTYSPENIAEELDQFMKGHSDNSLIRLEQSC